jgi:hypothetical protein
MQEQEVCIPSMQVLRHRNIKLSSIVKEIKNFAPPSLEGIVGNGNAIADLYLNMSTQEYEILQDTVHYICNYRCILFFGKQLTKINFTPSLLLTHSLRQAYTLLCSSVSM